MPQAHTEASGTCMAQLQLALSVRGNSIVSSARRLQGQMRRQFQTKGSPGLGTRAYVNHLRLQEMLWAVGSDAMQGSRSLLVPGKHNVNFCIGWHGHDDAAVDG